MSRFLGVFILAVLAPCSVSAETVTSHDRILRQGTLALRALTDPSIFATPPSRDATLVVRAAYLAGRDVDESHFSIAAQTPLPGPDSESWFTLARQSGIPSTSEILAGSERRAVLTNLRATKPAPVSRQADAVIPSAALRGLAAPEARNFSANPSASAELRASAPDKMRATTAQRRPAARR